MLLGVLIPAVIGGALLLAVLCALLLVLPSGPDPGSGVDEKIPVRPWFKLVSRRRRGSASPSVPVLSPPFALLLGAAGFGALLGGIAEHAWFAAWGPVLIAPIALAGTALAARYVSRGVGSKESTRLLLAFTAPTIYLLTLAPGWVLSQLRAGQSLGIASPLQHDRGPLIALAFAAYVATVSWTTRELLQGRRRRR